MPCGVCRVPIMIFKKLWGYFRRGEGGGEGLYGRSLGVCVARARTSCDPATGDHKGPPHSTLPPSPLQKIDLF